MKNNKGLIGQLLIFVVVVAISSGFIFAIYKSGNQTAAEVFFNDDLRSVSILADAIVNSPNCLLYTENDTSFQPPKIVASRGTVDWEKIIPKKAGCARKGPYLWNAAVKDLDEKRDREINSYSKDVCNNLGERSFPVLIKKGSKFNKGKATVSIASKDALATFSRAAGVISVALKNTGSCDSKFKITPTIINATSGDPISELQVACLPAGSASLKRGKVATLACALPPVDLSAYDLKIEISPDGMEYYAKEYRIGL